MGKCNIEGYRDLTAYYAIINTEKEIETTNPNRGKPSHISQKPHYKPLVYICSPFKGDVENNIHKARLYCRFAVENNAIPLAPHLLFPQFMDDSDPKQRELGIFFGLVLLGKCDELWYFGDNITAGMKTELVKAYKRSMPIRYFDSEFKEMGCVIPCE